MNIKVLGPVVSATMLFVIAGAIKIIAFNSTSVWFDLVPEVALWGVGVLFTISVSEYTYFRAKLVVKSKRVDALSQLVTYEPSIPETIQFNPRFIYLFFYAMTVWILTILLIGAAASNFEATKIASVESITLYGISVMLAGSVVGLSIACLFEIEQ